MSYLKRDEILASIDATIREVSVEEWGKVGSNPMVGVRTFDGATRARLLKPAADGAMPDNWMETIVAASACDESGNLLFTDKDLEALSKKNAVVLERLFTVAIELNGLADTSREKIEGESKPTPK